MDASPFLLLLSLSASGLLVASGATALITPNPAALVIPPATAAFFIPIQLIALAAAPPALFLGLTVSTASVIAFGPAVVISTAITAPLFTSLILHRKWKERVLRKNLEQQIRLIVHEWVDQADHPKALLTIYDNLKICVQSLSDYKKLLGEFPIAQIEEQIIIKLIPLVADYIKRINHPDLLLNLCEKLRAFEKGLDPISKRSENFELFHSHLKKLLKKCKRLPSRFDEIPVEIVYMIGEYVNSPGQPNSSRKNETPTETVHMIEVNDSLPRQAISNRALRVSYSRFRQSFFRVAKCLPKDRQVIAIYNEDDQAKQQEHGY